MILISGKITFVNEKVFNAIDDVIIPILAVKGSEIFLIPTFLSIANSCPFGFILIETLPISNLFNIVSTVKSYKESPATPNNFSTIDRLNTEELGIPTTTFSKALIKLLGEDPILILLALNNSFVFP